MSRLLPLTARVSQEDIDFLSKIDVEGARSTGDKVRHIIAEARLRREGRQDYDSAFRMIEDILAPAASGIRNAEKLTGMHSELVERVIHWLPDTMAQLISSETVGGEREESQISKAIKEVEKGLAIKLFLLLESVLRMGITRRSSCYNESIIYDNMEPLSELCAIVDEKQNKFHGGGK